MRWISTIAIILACGACRSPPEGPQVAVLPEQTQPVCHDFTTPIMAGGRPEQANGQACEQPDGSWQVEQNTPGLPAQGYVLEPPGHPAAATSSPIQLQPTQPVRNQSTCSRYTAPVT